MEQLARESKINSIWEGTNYIQALDLIGRKLAMNDGKVFKSFFKESLSAISSLTADENGKAYLLILNDAIAILEETTMMLFKWKK